MSKIRQRVHAPSRGEICRIDLDPTKGPKEIGKYRPCLILSPREYNEKTRLCVVVPISSDEETDPLYVPVPDGLLELRSQALCDRVMSLSWLSRQCQLITAAPPEFVDEIVATINDLIDPLEK